MTDHDHDEHGEEVEVPEGAAILPDVPPEVPVHPLLLATLQPLVFLIASEENVVNPDAATLTLEIMLSYLHRLKGPQRDQVREDMACLLEFARQDGWGEGEMNVLQHVTKDFFTDFGDTVIGETQE